MEDDSYAWLLDQAAALRQRRISSLDWKNLAEELEEEAAMRRADVVGYLRVVLVHLLKWRYSRVRRSEHSWRKSLVAARVKLADLLEESGTLRKELPSLLQKAYPGARSVAGTEMRPDKRDWRLFPDAYPWTESQVLDQDFFPDIAPNANGRS